MARLTNSEILISISILRSLVNLGKSPLPPEMLTNAEFSAAIYYVVCKAELLVQTNKKEIKKFLENKAKYQDLQKLLQAGKLQPGDPWQALGAYLELEPPVQESQGGGAALLVSQPGYTLTTLSTLSPPSWAP